MGGGGVGDKLKLLDRRINPLLERGETANTSGNDCQHDVVPALSSSSSESKIINLLFCYCPLCFPVVSVTVYQPILQVMAPVFVVAIDLCRDGTKTGWRWAVTLPTAPKSDFSKRADLKPWLSSVGVWTYSTTSGPRVTYIQFESLAESLGSLVLTPPFNQTSLIRPFSLVTGRFRIVKLLFFNAPWTRTTRPICASSRIMPLAAPQPNGLRAEQEKE